MKSPLSIAFLQLQSTISYIFNVGQAVGAVAVGQSAWQVEPPNFSLQKPTVPSLHYLRWRPLGGAGGPGGGPGGGGGGSPAFRARALMPNTSTAFEVKSSTYHLVISQMVMPFFELGVPNRHVSKAAVFSRRGTTPRQCFVISKALTWP